MGVLRKSKSQDTKLSELQYIEKIGKIKVSILKTTRKSCHILYHLAISESLKKCRWQKMFIEKSPTPKVTQKSKNFPYKTSTFLFSNFSELLITAWEVFKINHATAFYSCTCFPGLHHNWTRKSNLSYCKKTTLKKFKFCSSFSKLFQTFSKHLSILADAIMLLAAGL